LLENMGLLLRTELYVGEIRGPKSSNLNLTFLRRSCINLSSDVVEFEKHRYKDDKSIFGKHEHSGL